MRQPLDCWSGWHLFGSFFLVCLIESLYSCTVVDAAKGAFALGVIWECLDDWLGKRSGIKGFDSRGFSFMDIACDFVGCALAIIII